MVHVTESDHQGPVDTKNDVVDESEVEEKLEEIVAPGSSGDTFTENRISRDTEANDDNDNNLRADIPYDSFSMLWAAQSFTDHGIPLGIFILQASILVLISINLLQEEDGGELTNYWKVPVEVPLTVTLSQYIACFVSVFTAEDLITGVLFIGKHIIHKDYSSLDDRLRPISLKWEFVNCLRIIEGMGVIIVSFVFIVQSSTVIDLL